MSHLPYFAYEGFGETAQKDLHYSQAVRIGNTIEISGQGGWDPLSSSFPPPLPASLSLEMDRAFANVERALRNAGGTGWDQVYKVRCYAKPLDAELIEHFVRNLRTYCPRHRPLVTGVGVEGLAFEGMRVEIEVKADLGGGGEVEGK